MRDDTTGQADACPAGAAKKQRTPATYEDYCKRFGIVAGLPEDEKFDKLVVLFDFLSSAAGNFFANCGNREERDRRLNEARDRTTPTVKENVMGQCAEQIARSVGMLERCVGDMGETSVATVNGRSVIFTECKRLAGIFRTSLTASKDLIAETKLMIRRDGNEIVIPGLKLDQMS